MPTGNELSALELTGRSLEFDEPRETVPGISPHADRPDALNMLAVDANELTPQQKAISVMQNFQINEDAFFAETAERLDEIMKLVPSRAFKALDLLFEKYFSDQMVAYIINSVPEGHPDFAVERGAKFDSTVLKGLKAQSIEYNTWFRLLALVANFKNSVIQRYAESDAGKEYMHPAARLEYAHFHQIAAASNELYLTWHNDSGRLLSPEQRKERGFKNEIATVNLSPEGDYVENPWVSAFPKEIEQMVTAYRPAAQSFRELADQSESDEDKKLCTAKGVFYETIAEAYEQSTFDAFKKADTLLPGQNCGRTDMPVHIHTIEYGYGADPVQRAPETHLRYPDADGAEINKTALQARTDMLRELKQLLKNGHYSEDTEGTVKMLATTTYLATHFLGSGFGLDFVAAGQILPNEEDCRLNGGISVTVNKEGMSKRIEQFHEGLEATFGVEIAEKYMPRGKVDLDKMSGRGIASHEFGHTVAMTKSAMDRLGKAFIATYIEEWKATTGGMVLAEWRTFNSKEQANVVTMDDLRESIIQHLAGAGRYATNRAASFSQPYFRKSVMLVNAMEAEGIVVQGENGWDIDLSDEKVQAFYRRLDAQYLQVLDIYDHGMQEDLEAFLAENLKPQGFIRHIVNSVDTKFPDKVKGAQTLEELCAI